MKQVPCALELQVGYSVSCVPASQRKRGSVNACFLDGQLCHFGRLFANDRLVTEECASAVMHSAKNNSVIERESRLRCWSSTFVERSRYVANACCNVLRSQPRKLR